MSSERTRKCNITQKVRKIVNERDGFSCVFCGSSYGVQLCHVVPRSKGGLGIPENLVCGCAACHGRMDQSVDRADMLAQADDYLRSIYPEFDQVRKIYQKWNGLFN